MQDGRVEACLLGARTFCAIFADEERAAGGWHRFPQRVGQGRLREPVAVNDKFRIEEPEEAALT